MILDFVDRIFENNANFKKNGYQPHKAVRKGVGKIEIWPQIEPEKKKNDGFEWKNSIINDEESEDFCQKEEMAKRIVENILSWVKNGRELDGYGYKRKVEFCDVMILLRNRANGFDRILQKSFEENNIPFKGVKKMKFSESLIIQDLLSLLKFALLPNDDLNLACLLKSPFFGFDEEKLLNACLKKNDDEISLFEALEEGDDAKKLNNIVELGFEINSYEFFSKLIDEEGRQKYVSEFGENANLIIDQFLVEVMNFCENKLSNLQKFFDYVVKIDPEIVINDTSDNCVLVSTIHSAKGLQAPIVILPDCCFNFNKMRAAKESLLWMNFENVDDSEDKMPIWLVKKSEENRYVKNFRKSRLQELKDEYWRLFYVALTRAENELYISGFGSDNDEDSWYSTSLKVVEGF